MMPLARLVLSLMPICLLATSVTADWTHWGGDAASTKFAPYDQIHAGNVDSLKILWRYRVPGGVAAQSDDDDDEGLSSAGYKGTPIVVDGFCTPSPPSATASPSTRRRGGSCGVSMPGAVRMTRRVSSTTAASPTGPTDRGRHGSCSARGRTLCIPSTPGRVCPTPPSASTAVWI